MPKLVAYYLKEFSVNSSSQPSNLYKFVFCLCLPFISKTFNRARMIALMISECTQSADQIGKVLNAITGADISFINFEDTFFCGYDGTSDVPNVHYSGKFYDVPLLPYSTIPNASNMHVTLNGYSQKQFESYLSLLIPFYVSIQITYE